MNTPTVVPAIIENKFVFRVLSLPENEVKEKNIKKEVSRLVFLDNAIIKEDADGNDSISFVEPESLFFWLDFNDQDGSNPELFQYSVDVIGRRAKAINDDKVKCIYLRETPGILFTSDEWPSVDGEENLGYTRISIAPPVSDYFRISSQGKSAKEELDSTLYDCTYFQESITFSSIPIYYLEPNTRITVRDDQSGINGEYLIKSLSLQLQHDGMMSVTATRAVDRVI